jgi:hypothetical protein
VVPTLIDHLKRMFSNPMDAELLHISDDQKRLGFVNPTQVNQLELNSIINEKVRYSRTLVTRNEPQQIKKHNKNRECIMTPYNFE